MDRTSTHRYAFKNLHMWIGHRHTEINSQSCKCRWDINIQICIFFLFLTVIYLFHRHFMCFQKDTYIVRACTFIFTFTKLSEWFASLILDSAFGSCLLKQSMSPVIWIIEWLRNTVKVILWSWKLECLFGLLIFKVYFVHVYGSCGMKI